MKQNIRYSFNLTDKLGNLQSKKIKIFENHFTLSESTLTTYFTNNDAAIWFVVFEYYVLG